MLATKSTADRHARERLRFETSAATRPKSTNWKDAESMTIGLALLPLEEQKQLASRVQLRR